MNVNGGVGGAAEGGGKDGSPLIDEATAAAYNKLIAEQAEATRHLTEVLKRDLRDIVVLNRERAAMRRGEAPGQHQYRHHGGGGMVGGGGHHGGGQRSNYYGTSSFIY